MNNEWGLIDVPVDEVEQVPIEVHVPPGYWRRDDTHMPLPLTPMTDSLTSVGDGFGQACVDFGLLVQPVFTVIGGWYYTSIQPVGGKPDASPPPGWLMPLLLRTSSAARKRMRRSKEVARTGFADQVINRWNTEWRPQVERRAGELRDANLSAMDAEQLALHLAQAHELAEDGIRLHFRVNIANWFALADLTSACRDLLGWQQNEVDKLLAGLSARTSEPARKLAELAGKPEDSPEFKEYVRVYGCRSLTLELADPTIAEVPGLVWSLLHSQAARGYNAQADTDFLASERTEAANEARKSLRGEELKRFERALARAVAAYPAREDNVFFNVDAPNALMRYAVLEIGRRLAENNQIAAEDDVFFLKSDEAIDALRDGTGRQALVLLRRGEHNWALANPGPVSYGRDPGPPNTRWLRPDLRTSTETLLWAADKVLASDLSNRPKQQEATTLGGICGSPGRYRGTVRVVMSEDDFAKLQAGDVLVCPSTRPSWSMLFPSTGAIVTDAGGTLSHPAIIAREHRIPAVVATGSATTALRDGQTVIVDGTRGVVEVVA